MPDGLINADDFKRFVERNTSKWPLRQPTKKSNNRGICDPCDLVIPGWEIEEDRDTRVTDGVEYVRFTARSTRARIEPLMFTYTLGRDASQMSTQKREEYESYIRRDAVERMWQEIVIHEAVCRGWV